MRELRGNHQVFNSKVSTIVPEIETLNTQYLGTLDLWGKV